MAVTVVGVFLFALPMILGWRAAQGEQAEHEDLVFRGAQVVTMQIGVHEGLPWLYAWGPALGLRRSIDGGRTWSDALDFPVRPRFLARANFAVDPRDARNVLLMLPSHRGRDLYRLEEDDRWRRVRTFASELDAPLLVAPADEGVYAAWGLALWRWMPDGDWQLLRKWENAIARSVASFPVHREILLLTTDQLWRSADGGEHWQPLGIHARKVKTSRAPTGDAYALVGDEVWHSSDWGTTWTRLEFPAQAVDLAVPPVYKDIIYVLDEEGQVWRRGPGVEEWQVVLQGGDMTPRGLLADPTRPGVLYIHGNNGILIFSETLPTPTSTPTFTATYTPSPTPTTTPFLTPTPTQPPQETASPTSTSTPTPTPTDTFTPTPTPTFTPSPTHTPTSTPTSTPVPTTAAPPTEQPLVKTPPPPPAPPTPTDTPTPISTPLPLTPSPTPTPAPTPTPTRTPGPPPER